MGFFSWCTVTYRRRATPGILWYSRLSKDRRGFADVDERCGWNPGLISPRVGIEKAFQQVLREAAGAIPSVGTQPFRDGSSAVRARFE